MRERKHDHASRFAALSSSLTLSAKLNSTQIWPVLYVLADLQGTSKEHPRISELDKENGDAGLIAPSTEIMANVQQNDNAAKTTFSLPTMSLDPTLAQTHDLLQSNSPLNGETNNSISSPVPGDAQYHHHSSIASKQKVQQTPTTLRGQSLEKSLVHDLLMVAQGHSGSILSFEGDGDDDDIQINLPPSTTLTLAMYNMVHCIAETGFLFRVIQRRVREVDTTISSTDTASSRGLVVQNLCRAIVREIDVYYKSLALLRRMEHTDETQAGSGLTLRRLYVWSQAEIPRLRWLARLCDETRTLKGAQILRHVLQRRASYVSTDIHEMMNRILINTAAPINRMLIRWLAEGELGDADGEFFIREDPKVAALMKAGPFSGADLVEEDTRITTALAGGLSNASLASHRIWWGLFKLRRDMYAGSIDASLAQYALITGKSVAFLRRCCSDNQWVDQVHVPLVTRLTAGGRKLFEADHRFDRDIVKELIMATRESACNRLKELFFDKFDLSHHFGAIKRYLLLSQGDFAQALMDGLAPILDSGPNILRSNLTGTIDAALQGCSSFNIETDKDILERLDVQIITQDGVRSGWDVFSLVYRVQDAPLNTVFSEKVMEAYFGIFRFLWRLKRMDYLISKGFIALREAERRAKKLWQDGETLWTVRRLLYLRMKMTHVIHNLQHYCTVEVLEGSWAILENDMRCAEDLDGMIQAHAKYLTVIKDRTLVSERSKYVAKELSGVLDTIPDFDKLQTEICKLVERAEFEGADDSEVSVEVKSRLDELEVRFDVAFERLLKVIAQHTKMVDTCVFLLFRLDFNRYYARREEEARNKAAEQEDED